MKRLFFFVLGLIALSGYMSAQQYDVLDQVRSDIRKSYGMEGPHRFDAKAPLTKAPCGYKPFYISHYGRHGSRYAWNSKTYTIIRDVLEKASECNALTPYGEQFRAKYLDFYMEPWINAGDLVPLGFEQHRKIGEFAAASFPEVFKGNRKVMAISSTAQRCIVSMGAFTLGLKSRNGNLAVTLSSNHKGMAVAVPPSAPEELVRHFKGEKDEPALESPASYSARLAPADEVLDKLFTDKSFIKDVKYGDRFVSELWQLYCGYHNYEPAPLFDDLLTDSQRLAFWEAENYESYIIDATQRYKVIPLLEDIVAKAAAAFDDPAQAADLRFGHDYVLEALAALMNINGCGTAVTKPEDAKYWFQNYSIPMAATLMMVFYRGGKGDILFKVLMNEEEATLPQLEAVKGHYYRWSDFLKWYDELLLAHPEI
ncbi:MAG: hypothetical protein IKZ91_03360 [Bacteroidales bacterium]|nr:hypothetical protein [Bacteroidales bacterium]